MLRFFVMTNKEKLENRIQYSSEADAGDVELLLHGFVPAIDVMISVAVPGWLVLIDRICQLIGLPNQLSLGPLVTEKRTLQGIVGLL